MKYIKTKFNEYLNESNTKKRGSLKTFTDKFNQKMKKEELDSLIEDTKNDLKMINESIASRYISTLSFEYLGIIPIQTEFRNKSKNPENHFQLETYLTDGNILFATFIYVDNEHKVILDKCNIELLNDDYETIEIIK